MPRRKFSRWMPPLETKPLRWWQYVVLFPFLGLIVSGVIAYYLVLLPAWPYLLLLYFRDRRDLAARAAGRMGEDIGTFARSFDRRSKNFDPWVIRATWDALMLYMDYPIRAADRIDDLGIDSDEIFFCVIPEVIEHSGHVVAGEQPDTHPRRETVGDLVLWVSSLKRIEDTRPPTQAGQSGQA